jgi:hypothetical protein
MISSKYGYFGGFFSQNPLYEFVESFFSLVFGYLPNKERLVVSLIITLIKSIVCSFRCKDIAFLKIFMVEVQIK